MGKFYLVDVKVYDEKKDIRLPDGTVLQTGSWRGRGVSPLLYELKQSDNTIDATVDSSSAQE